MILHCVFCALRDDLAPGAWEEMAGALEAFALTLPGIQGFEHGPNRDFEGKSPSFKAGFVMRCASRAALAGYAEHPTHKDLGSALCALCVGGAEGVTVFDLEV